MFADESRQLKVCSQSVTGVRRECIVQSTEHRIRIYHILSTREFSVQSDNHTHFSIPNVEFNKIVTAQAIISGSNGGVAKVSVTPTSTTECTICFFIQNNGGAFGKVSIYTSTMSDDVTIHHMPTKPIEVTIFAHIPEEVSGIIELSDGSSVHLHFRKRNLVTHLVLKMVYPLLSLQQVPGI